MSTLLLVSQVTTCIWNCHWSHTNQEAKWWAWLLYKPGTVSKNDRKQNYGMPCEWVYEVLLLYYRPYVFVAENPCFISQLLQLRSTDRLCWRSSHVCGRKSDFPVIRKVSVSRDLWPWPWPSAQQAALQSTVSLTNYFSHDPAHLCDIVVTVTGWLWTVQWSMQYAKCHWLNFYSSRAIRS